MPCGNVQGEISAKLAIPSAIRQSYLMDLSYLGKMKQSARAGAKIVLSDHHNQTNRVVFSRYEKLEAATVCKGYSLKYVLSGEETYSIGGRRWAIKAKQYLMVNDEQEIAVQIDAPKTVEGLCVFLSQELLDQVYTHHHQAMAKTLEQDPIEKQRLFPGMFPFRFLAENSDLGRYLGQLASQIQVKTQDGEFADKSALFAMGELLLRQQKLQHSQIQSLGARKASTREELFRRLCLGKDYLLDHWDQAPRIPDAAREAALSEYHFYRLFRRAFQQSPLQFLHQYRLQKAHHRLLTRRSSITEIAESCGFYDVHHFNKAFRRHFGRGPSLVRMGQLAV